VQKRREGEKKLDINTMGVVYYKYKSSKETISVPVPHSFVSVSELKQLILTSDKHGRGRTRGRGPREDIVLSNAQTGEGS
jgi:E3 ubiquitin-protein ligase RBBP6